LSNNQIKIKKEDNKMLSVGGNVSQLMQQVSQIQEDESLLSLSTEYNPNISQLIRTNKNVFISQVSPEHRSDTI
jgi:hypothetical protein